MLEQDLLRDLLVSYAIGLASALLLGRLRLPPVVAMIMAGAVTGPAGLRVVHTPERVEALAEIGIVLLLFTVGLDFSLAEVRRIWRAVVLGGTLQVGGTVLVVLAGLAAAGAPPTLGIVVGVFVAMSSTAIVLRGLADRDELDAPHGRLMVGVLLYQDLAIVLLLLLVPILAAQTPSADVPIVLARMLVALAAVAAIARLALPWLMRLVIASGRHEVFGLAILLASVGTAWVCSLLGVPRALGAFLGGLVLAESEFSHQAHAEIRPLRDILASLFFISVGMLLDPQVIVERLPLVMAASAVVVLGKATVAAGAMVALGSPVRVAAIVGVGLAQVGEFSFIFGRAGLDAGLLSRDLWQTLLACSILTMVMTPALLRLGPEVGLWLAGARGRQKDELPTASELGRLRSHVIVLGFGLGGQSIAAALREEGLPYLVMELNGATVRRARDAGEPICYGDATSRDALEAAGVGRARAVVLVLSDPDATRRAVRTIRAISPVTIIARTRYRVAAEQMERLGATVAVAEEIETSLEVLAQLLARLHVPANRIEDRLERLRHASTIRSLRAPTLPFDAMPSGIRRTPITTHELTLDDWAAGRTVADTRLRSETGASIVAVQRGAEYQASPPPDRRLEAGDVVYLLGDAASVTTARRYLREGSTERDDR